MTDAAKAEKADPKAALFALITNDGPLAEVEKLLDEGVDPNGADKTLGTLLGWAAACGREGIIELLLLRGAAINGSGPRGETPLIVALSRHKLIAAQLLVERGADVDVRSRWGHGPLYYATQSGDQALCEKLLCRMSQKPDAEVLLEAARRGDLALTALFIDAGADVNAPSGLGAETPLHSAAYNGKLEVVRHLLDKGAALAARDSRGNTALMHAAWSGHLDVIKYLSTAGADINAQNKLGWNALMQAALQGHVEVARFLIDSGSRLDEIDREQGATALSLARTAKSAPLFALLLERGAREREIRRPQPGAGYFLITDCDVCAYLPHRKELSRSDTPDDIAELQALHKVETSPARYTTDTVFIRRCTVCGTHYHHDHSIDTEDAFVTPPSISQHLLRYNLLGLIETLRSVEMHEELAAVQERYPHLIERFTSILQNDAATLNPNIRPYLVENVVDALLAREAFAELCDSLLRHRNADIALETARNLIWIFGAAQRANTYPYFFAYRDVVNDIASKLKPWLLDNRERLDQVLSALAETADQGLQKRVLEARKTAQYAKLL